MQRSVGLVAVRDLYAAGCKIGSRRPAVCLEKGAMQLTQHVAMCRGATLRDTVTYT